MLVTDDDYIYERCLVLCDHGRNPGDIFFQNNEIGFKYKMSNLQAALGLAQLERINELISKKRQIFEWYNEIFQDCQDLILNPSNINTYNSYWMTTGIFKKLNKKTKFQIVHFFKKYNISTRPFFSPLSSLKAFKLNRYSSKSNKNAYSICSSGINFPSSFSLTKNECLHVKDVFKKLVHDGL